MPDKRHHRGKHPEDDRLFAPSFHEALRTAVAEYAWLLTHGYATESALKLVGDRHALTARQRMAVMRCACADQALSHRGRNLVPPQDCRGSPLGIDGYNVLITIESALSGGLVLVGRDGCYRDLAGVHGTYRKVEETQPAVEFIIDFVDSLPVKRVDWYLDRPVSNSGRLKTLMAEVLDERSGEPRLTWNIELVDSPDKMLRVYPGVIATADSGILDTRPTGCWMNLARAIIDERNMDAWRLDLATMVRTADPT